MRPLIVAWLLGSSRKTHNYLYTCYNVSCSNKNNIKPEMLYCVFYYLFHVVFIFLRLSNEMDIL